MSEKHSGSSSDESQPRPRKRKNQGKERSRSKSKERSIPDPDIPLAILPSSNEGPLVPLLDHHSSVKSLGPNPPPFEALEPTEVAPEDEVAPEVAPEVAGPSSPAEPAPADKEQIDHLIYNFLMNLSRLNKLSRFKKKKKAKTEDATEDEVDLAEDGGDEDLEAVVVEERQYEITRDGQITLLKLRNLIENHEQEVIRMGIDRVLKEKRRLKHPDRDLTTTDGRIKHQMDGLLQRVSDILYHCKDNADDYVIDPLDDARLYVYRGIRDALSCSNFQSFGLQTAISLFKDVIKDCGEPERQPITDIPPCDENEEDAYAIFRYLEECAIEQGAQLRMNPYITLETDDNKLNALIESRDLDLRDYYGQTVLHIAAQYCEPKDVEKMINTGADPNAPDFDGFTPLFYAAIALNALTAESLIKNNANIDHRCEKTGRAPIHIAAQFGALDVMELLIENGADVDSRDNIDHTPIIISSYYTKSDVSAALVEKGADPCIEDVSGVMGIMRIAFTMPTITREVFDKFVTEDVYQGERYYQLDKMLGSTGRTFCSFYHYLVWLANMGLIEHSIFERLTNAKWNLYAKRHANYKFLFLGIFLMVWSGVYVQPHSNIDKQKGMDVFYIFTGVLAMIVYIFRAIDNVKLLRKRFEYMSFLKKLFKDTYQRETSTLHFKGRDLDSFLKKKYGSKNITFMDDMKSSPAVIIDFLVDNLLFIYLLMKLGIWLYGGNDGAKTNYQKAESRVTDGNSTAPIITIGEVTASAAGRKVIMNWIDLYGALVIIFMWLSCFFKLQVTKKVGPFVVYMKYVGQDLSTIFTMFVTLFIPAACVFYKTVYMHLGCKASLDEDGYCPEEAQRKWYETIFIVLRMVLIDYNYDEGAKATQTSFPIWWMVASISWIVVSSVVVLNLLIALMADSYSRIFESAELFARIERARFIIEFEREMTQEQLEGYEQTIRVQYAPEIVTFDPVCDRDKIDIIEEHVETLGTKVDRLEALIEKRILVDLQKKLEAIDQALTLYNY